MVYTADTSKAQMQRQKSLLNITASCLYCLQLLLIAVKLTKLKTTQLWV